MVIPLRHRELEGGGDPVLGPSVARLAIAFGAGLWVGLVFLVPRGAAAIGIAAAALSLVRRGTGSYLLAAAVVGLGIGTVHRLAQRLTCAAQWAPGPHAALIAVQDRPGRRGVTSGAVLHAAGGCGGDLRLRMTPDAPIAGRHLVAVGIYRGGGVFRVHHFRLLGSRAGLRFVIRDQVAMRLAHLYGERAPIVHALVLGRRGDLEPAIRQQFADAGLAHLLAISGLHVGIAAGWVLLALRWLGMRRWVWVVSTTVTWCYVALLGFPAPATRAATFVTVQAAGRLRQRHPPPSAVLAVAVLAVVSVDPGAATSVGAWLSTAAVWGTDTARRMLPQSVRGSALMNLLAASVGATVATAPITAFVFGAVAPIGVVANLAAVPLAGFAVPGLFASIALGSTMAAGTGAVLAILERIAEVASRVPFGHIRETAGVAFAVPWFGLLM